MNERLDQLLDLYLLDEATRGERIELVDLLRQHPEHRRALVHRVLLEAELYRASGERVRAPDLPPTEPVIQTATLPIDLASPGALRARPSRRHQWMLRVAIAAMVLLSIGLSAWIVLPRWLDSKPVAANPTVTAGQVQIRQADGSYAPAVAGQIARGSALRATSDRPAVLALPDGSVVTLAAGAEAIVRGASGELRQVVELSSGSADFTVTPGRGQFRVDTPAGNVVVLGTEFTVKVRPASAARGASDRGDADENPEARHRRLSAGAVESRPELFVAVNTGRVRVERAGKQYELVTGQARVFRGGDRALVEGNRYEGIAAAVDPAERTIQLRRQGDGGPRVQTFRVHDDAVVQQDGREIDLANLPIGAAISARLSADTSDELARIEVRGKEVVGYLLAVDESSQTITLNRVREGDASRNSYRLAADVIVQLDDRTGRLADLVVGSRVVLTLSADEMVVRKIAAPRKRIRDNG